MVIYLKSGGKLREKLKPDIDQYTRKVELENAMQLREILSRLDIPADSIAFAFVDGNLKRLDYVPENGQIIILQPPVSGG